MVKSIIEGGHREATTKMISTKVLRGQRSDWGQVLSRSITERATLKMIPTKVMTYKTILHYQDADRRAGDLCELCGQ